MSIKKLSNGKYLLSIRPHGSKGKQVRKQFTTKQSALNYQRKLLTEDETTTDKRTINELVQIWHIGHGKTLKSSADTKNRLLFLSNSINNPIAQQLQVEDYIKYRSQRLEQGIKPSTLNREYTTLCSMFNELQRMGIIHYKTKLIEVRKLKEVKTELSFLTSIQIERLLQESSLSKNDSLYYVVLLCLSTGSRWSEAEGITINNLKNKGVEFLDTKNGLNRFVPLSPQVYLDLSNFLNLYNKFESCYAAFRSALKRTEIVTPAGQSAHILRHSFASHFIMNGGNILTLQKILGHSSLLVTTRYAHLAPNYLNEATIYNPIEYK